MLRARNAGVADQEHGRSQRGDAAADQPDLTGRGIEVGTGGHRVSPQFVGWAGAPVTARKKASSISPRGMAALTVPCTAKPHHKA